MTASSGNRCGATMTATVAATEAVHITIRINMAAFRAFAKNRITPLASRATVAANWVRS